MVVVGIISQADSEMVIVGKSLTLTWIAAGTAIARMGIARNTEGPAFKLHRAMQQRKR